MKTVPLIFLRTCKIVSRNPCINRESNTESPKFSYTPIILTTTMKFLAVVTPSYIYRCWSTQKTLWEDNFTLVNMTSCGSCNVTKHRDIKLIQLWFGVECAEQCWETRVNPYQGIRARAWTSTVQIYGRGERHAYEQHMRVRMG